jgi:hypothetical protein
VRRDTAVWMLKGHMAELLYKHLPEFAALRADVEKLLKNMPGWRKEVEFEPIVTGLDAKPRRVDLQLTDGLLVAYSEDRSRVLVLAVLESKSPSNVHDLVRKPRTKGDAPWWAGQYHKDFERLSELPLVLEGRVYAPENVIVSRRITRWIAVVPHGHNGPSMRMLQQQGFQIDTWKLPVTDGQLNKTAAAIFEELD